MLPVTHHRALTVPHSVAIVAAAVALGLSLLVEPENDANGLEDPAEATAVAQQPAPEDPDERENAEVVAGEHARVGEAPGTRRRAEDMRLRLWPLLPANPGGSGR